MILAPVGLVAVGIMFGANSTAAAELGLAAAELGLEAGAWQLVSTFGLYKNWTIESFALSSPHAVRSSYPILVQSKEIRFIGQYRHMLHALPPTVISQVATVPIPSRAEETHTVSPLFTSLG
jgi:hypothetical protein